MRDVLRPGQVDGGALQAAAGTHECPACQQLVEQLSMGDAAEPALTSVCGRHKLFLPAKYTQLKEWITRDVPPADKVIVFSTFKGALDIAEGLLTQLEIPSRRFDGDDPEKQQQYVSLL